MKNLNKLISLCKGGVYLSVNEHKNIYESAKEYLMRDQDIQDVHHEVFEKMVEFDCVVELQYYPNTPVGFNRVYHYDVGAAIEEALAFFEGAV